MKKLTDERMSQLRLQAKDSEFTSSRFWYYIYADLVIAEFCKINGLTGEAQPAEWHDEKPDEYTPLIEAAHPLKTKNYKAWDTAMQMVGNRRNKHALVELVCWLLQRVEEQPAKQAKGQEAVARVVGGNHPGATPWVRWQCIPYPKDGTLLYTTPPAQPAREWVGLSGGDFLKLHDEFGIIPDTARVIEKLLREKNAGQPIIHKDEDLLRERFHAWARAQGFDDRVLVKPRTTYTGSHLQMLWEAWLACASTTRNQHEQENDHTEGGSPPA